MLRKLMVFVAALMFLLPAVASAQFGKNSVRYHSLNHFTESQRFDVWHDFDLNDPAQMEYLRQVIENLEGARDWLGSSKVFNHNIEQRIPVFLYRTHTDMESSNLVGGFMPEGVGAFAESQRRRMVIKADFSGPLGRAIGTHELTHEFQFYIENPNILQRKVNPFRLPDGYYEGCAEFLAGLYDPHTRDDNRRREQRSFASNPKSLPTWIALHNSDRVNPYTMWSMIPEFLEDKYSGGIAFCTQPLKNKTRLGEFVYDLTRGELGNPDVNSEKFDQHARHYWGTERGFEVDRINRPKPYEENNNFKGRTITPYGHPYPMRSLMLSPDGYQAAAFTIQNNGVAIVRYDIPKENVYISKEDREKAKKRSILGMLRSNPNPIKNLTPQLPPIPWEYMVVQGLEAWTIFNGSDGSWWQEPYWVLEVKGVRQELEEKNQSVAKLSKVSQKERTKDHNSQVEVLENDIKLLEKKLEELKRKPNVNEIDFFARVNRDHALVIIDAETGKIIKKIEFKSTLLDQAFTPSFSKDGKKVYFSAAKNTARDIYVIDLESEEVTNLTKDGKFNTAPALSPDGTKVVYVGFDGDFQHLFMLHLEDGRKEQISFGGFNDSSPSWSDDGSTLVYTSDEANMIWNLYTMELATHTVSQWTEFIGGVETPSFARGSLDKAYYVVFRDDDQYRDFIYPNYEAFEAKLKKPIRQYVAADGGDSNIFAFNPSRNLFRHQLDSNQLLNPKKAPEKWTCDGGDLSVGVSTYYGMFGQSYFGCNNMLNTKQHLGQFAMYGYFRIIDYTYVNQEKRTGWRMGVHNYQVPLYYQFYDIVKQYPNQAILRGTWMNETSVDFTSHYPINKFNRWELYSRLRHRSFNVFGNKIGDIDESLIASSPNFNSQDLQMFRLLKDSNGSSLGFGAAFVRDTVLYSQNTWGPWNGNTFRAQLEVAPPVGNAFEGYVSTTVQARTYKRLSDGVLFAGRVDLMTSSRANGDFMLLCGPDRLRGCGYGSIVGNQIAYGSMELRFPVLDAIVGPGRLNFGGVRGFLFTDAALARFSGETFPAQKVRVYGFGLQYIEPLAGLPLQFVWRRNNGKWEPTFYITLNW